MKKPPAYISTIFVEMVSDDGADWKQDARLEQLYKQNPKMVDEVLLCICGWTFETIRQKAATKRRIRR